MIRKLINNTASPVLIFDTGVTIPASGQYTIPTVDYGLWEGSANVITKLSDYAVSPVLSTISANDGTFTLSVNDGVRMITGSWDTKISDGQDNTIKAKVRPVDGVNRLCVDALTNVPSGVIQHLTKKLRYLDMNPTTGGVLRGTNIVPGGGWIDIFNVSAKGYVHGFLINTEGKAEWLFRFLVDGENVFEGYDHTYIYKRIVNVTPNSFPVATYMSVNLNPTRANNTLYTVTINGTPYSYTSDATATDAEIAAGLLAVINVPSSPVTATGTSDVLITAKDLGVAFTWSVSATIVAAVVTANVPKEIYIQTVDGINYSFTSDGTPTDAEVVTGLKNLINANPTTSVIATGTTVLILTSKVAGVYFTYSGSANLTQTLMTDPFAPEIAIGGGISSDDINVDTIWDLDDASKEDYTGINLHYGNHDKLLWGFDTAPMKFDSSIKLQVNRVGVLTKKFLAGLIVITKENL